MYGLVYIGNLDGKATAAIKAFPGKASTTITKGDPVNLEAGYLNLAAAGESILGAAQETVVNGSGETAEVKVIVDPMAMYIVDNDNDTTTFGVTHPGTYFDVTGTTGAVQVDTSTTSTTGGLLCLEYNPQISPYQDDTSIGLFMIAESQLHISD